MSVDIYNRPVDVFYDIVKSHAHPYFRFKCTYPVNNSSDNSPNTITLKIHPNIIDPTNMTFNEENFEYPIDQIVAIHGLNSRSVNVTIPVSEEVEKINRPTQYNNIIEEFQYYPKIGSKTYHIRLGDDDSLIFKNPLPVAKLGYQEPITLSKFNQDIDHVVLECICISDITLRETYMKEPIEHIELHEDIDKFIVRSGLIYSLNYISE